MKTFEQHLITEKFINLFAKDIEKKRQYADEIWDILQSSYVKAGGLIGHGFSSKEDMIQNIPVWKIAKHQGNVVAVTMYKDKGGMKRIALGAKRVPGAKEKIIDMMLADLKFKRSWGEISGPSWEFLKKNFPQDMILAALIPVKTVQKLQPTKEIVAAYGKDPKITASDPYRDFWYTRIIGDGHFSTKLAIGHPGRKVY